ncbi:hypothetical protein F350042L8_20870 [Fusobacterium ulcerans]
MDKAATKNNNDNFFINPPFIYKNNQPFGLVFNYNSPIVKIGLNLTSTLDAVEKYF